MESTQAKSLIRLGHPRFHSFSDAAEAALEALADAVPGLIVLTRMEPDGQGCRVIDVRGSGVDGIARGAVLPLRVPANGDRTTSGDAADTSPEDALDREFLQSMGAQACLGMSLETSDGRIVGTLSALDPRAGAYGCDHLAMLGIAARLLSHEWERVELRAELGRLRRRASVDVGIDAETGLPNRDSFVDLLDQAWGLAHRGTVESVLVAFRIGTGPEERSRDGDAMSRLAVKVASEVLEGSARTTDRIGRVAEGTVAAVLVGCRAEDAPAFIERFRAALGRVTEGGNPRVELSFGVQVLAETPSSRKALELAEVAAGVPHQGQLAHASERGENG
jgi:GGDEF domain-containing protein